MSIEIPHIRFIALLPLVVVPAELAKADLIVTGSVEYWDRIEREYRPARNVEVELEGDWYWRADPNTHTNQFGRFRFRIEPPGFPHDAWHDDWDNVNIEAYAETDDVLDVKEHWFAWYSYSAESRERDNVPLDGRIEIDLRISGPDNNATDPTRSLGETANAILAHQEIHEFMQRLKEMGVSDDVFDEKDVIVPAAALGSSYYNHVTGNINIFLEDDPDVLELAGRDTSWRRLTREFDANIDYNDFKRLLRHEYSHAFHDEMSGWVPPAGLWQPSRHNPSIATNQHIALTEGFADFLPLTTLDIAEHRWEPSRTVRGRGRRLRAIDFESNNGFEMEGHVTGLLWDLFDRRRGEEYIAVPENTINGDRPVPRDLQDRMIWTEELEAPDDRNLLRILEILEEYDGAAPVDTIDEFLERYLERYPDELHEVKAVAFHRQIRRLKPLDGLPFDEYDLSGRVALGEYLPRQRPAYFDEELTLSRPAGANVNTIRLEGVVREADEEDQRFVEIEIHHEPSGSTDWTFYATTHILRDGWRGDRCEFNFQTDLAGATEFSDIPTGLTAPLDAGETLWLVVTEEMQPLVYRLEVPAIGGSTTLTRNDLRPRGRDPGREEPLPEWAGSRSTLRADLRNSADAWTRASGPSAEAAREMGESLKEFRPAAMQMEEELRQQAEHRELLQRWLNQAVAILGDEVFQDAMPRQPASVAQLLYAIEEGVEQAVTLPVTGEQQRFIEFAREHLQTARRQLNERKQRLTRLRERMNHGFDGLAEFLTNETLNDEVRQVVDDFQRAATAVEDGTSEWYEPSGPAMLKIRALEAGSAAAHLSDVAITVRKKDRVLLASRTDDEGTVKVPMTTGRLGLKLAKRGYYNVENTVSIDEGPSTHDVYLTRKDAVEARRTESRESVDFTVIVRNATTGEAMSDVDIVWRGPGQSLTRNKTNEFGVLQKTVQQAGKYTFAASKQGFEAAGGRLMVRQDRRNELTLRMKPQDDR